MEDNRVIKFINELGDFLLTNLKEGIAQGWRQACVECERESSDMPPRLNNGPSTRERLVPRLSLNVDVVFSSDGGVFG